MEHSHIRVKKSYAATSRRRDTCLLEMHQLSATTMRSSTLFKHLETTEAVEAEEEVHQKRGRDSEDLNTFGCISRKKSKVVFDDEKEQWVIQPNDRKCGIHPWLTSAVVTDLLVNEVDIDLVSSMLTPCASGLQMSYVQGITISPSTSSGMDIFTVYATRYII